MTFTVLYAANVLYPNVLRDVLIRLAQTGLVHARWTDRILDETFENLAEDRPDIPTATLTKRLPSMPHRTQFVGDERQLESAGSWRGAVVCSDVLDGWGQSGMP
ncbi:hypothetical protein [Rhodococcus opacus]|uniref:Uncharacterized protein n=1 Tax=Rhodococcus opacus TaxID=37919 RepID=A0A2S8I7R8_RHOOP|nr:hypothetical protein [Rhodococcus opacus]PQP10823.1 hypothetical protein C5613_43725 [Rhodococcus opacus]